MTIDTQALQEHLYELIVDHPMWIDGEGEALDYSPEREGRIGDFLDAAVLRITALAADQSAPTPPEADVQALAEDREMHLAEHVLHGLIPNWEQVAFCREQDSPAWRESLAIARAVLAAGYRPAPEPTDQTREQIDEVLAEHSGFGRKPLPRNNADWNMQRTRYEFACDCGQVLPWNDDGIAHRAHVADALAARLAVHVSPETAEERDQTVQAMTALADADRGRVRGCARLRTR